MPVCFYWPDERFELESEEGYTLDRWLEAQFSSFFEDFLPDVV